MDDQAWRTALERYLAGESAPAERARVEAWLREDPAREAYLQSLRTLGETWAQARPRFDSRTAWQRMTERLDDIAPPTPERRAAERRAPRFGVEIERASRRGVRRWLAAGAVAAAAIGALVVGGPLERLQVPVSVPGPREYATAAGQQMSLSLPDGTRLWIAPSSRLVIDGDYGRATRTIRLEGQAFFEVTHDEARPFRVLAGNTVAWDLGTRFAVRAYEGEPVRVAVEEGIVAIPQSLQAPLVAGDLATVDSTGRATVEHGADLARYSAWTRGTLEFRDTPVAEAVTDLARWYGAEIRVADAGLARRHITVTIADSSVDAALELVAAALGARYERSGQTFVLRSAPTSSRP